MATNLPPLPDVEQLSTSVIRIMGGNPSKFTLQGSNTYLLGTGPRRILLDTGEGRPIWASTLSRVLKEQNCTIATCLLTHWHRDHVGGVKDLLKLSSEELSGKDAPKVEVFKHLPSLNPDGILQESMGVQDIHDGQKFSAAAASSDPKSGEAFEVQALHTPGHAKDHMCFVVTSSSDADELGTIFTADNVLGHGTAVFEDLALYLQSLAIMKDRVLSSMNSSGGSKGRVTAHPGHGVVIDDALAKIEEYINHRRMREEEALNVLRYGTTKATQNDGAKDVETGKEWGSMEMVKVIYAQYPENLHQPAEWGLLMVLEKLRGDGKVVKGDKDGKTVWRAGEKKATL